MNNRIGSVYEQKLRKYNEHHEPAGSPKGGQFTSGDGGGGEAPAGSLETGRGSTYSDFHGSEVAFWKDAEHIIAGALQGGNPDCVLESTQNGAMGYFYDLFMAGMEESQWTAGR